MSEVIDTEWIDHQTDQYMSFFFSFMFSPCVIFFILTETIVFALAIGLINLSGQNF